MLLLLIGIRFHPEVLGILIIMFALVTDWSLICNMVIRTAVCCFVLWFFVVVFWVFLKINISCLLKCLRGEGYNNSL